MEALAGLGMVDMVIVTTGDSLRLSVDEASGGGLSKSLMGVGKTLPILFS